MRDSTQKYLDIVTAFNNRATQTELFCKQSQRICELLAKKLAAEKPKNGYEFEKNEYLKDFVIKTAKNNESTLDLLSYIHEFLSDMLEDSKILIEGAKMRDKLKFQSDTIQLQWRERDDDFKIIYNEKLDEISRGHKAITE